jgi:hypothetical protein
MYVMSISEEEKGAESTFEETTTKNLRKEMEMHVKKLKVFQLRQTQADSHKDTL